jgi:hypothetical protein
VKPKRAAGDRTGGAGKAEPKKRRWLEPLPTPDTPEFKLWRRVWVGLFVAGAILSVFALFQRESPNALPVLIAAYACLASAILIDIFKVRRIRKQYAAEQAAGGRKKGAGGSSASKGGEPEEKGR